MVIALILALVSAILGWTWGYRWRLEAKFLGALCDRQCETEHLRLVIADQQEDIAIARAERDQAIARAKHDHDAMNAMAVEANMRALADRKTVQVPSPDRIQRAQNQAWQGDIDD